jgi:hypothetical protein
MKTYHLKKGAEKLSKHVSVKYNRSISNYNESNIATIL